MQCINNELNKKKNEYTIQIPEEEINIIVNSLTGIIDELKYDEKATKKVINMYKNVKEQLENIRDGKI